MVSGGVGGEALGVVEEGFERAVEQQTAAVGAAAGGAVGADSSLESSDALRARSACLGLVQSPVPCLVDTGRP